MNDAVRLTVSGDVAAVTVRDTSGWTDDDAAAMAARIVATGTTTAAVEERLTRRHLHLLGATLVAGSGVVELRGEARREAMTLADLPLLLPGVAVDARRATGWRAAARRAISGMRSQVDAVVREEPEQSEREQRHSARPLSVVLPGDDDVVVEQVADVLRTAFGVRRRFGTAIDHLRAVAFDRSTVELRTGGAHVGQAHGITSTIHFTADLVTVPGWEALQQRVGWDPQFASRVAAHELWHLVHAWFVARQPAGEAALMRALGEHFGAGTLGHVTHRGGEGRDRLRAEVSAYATTNPAEATAEMFERWWCTPASEHPPAVRLFGDLVERLLPAQPPR